ncbi:monofunctional biosynthetic peptidoglycan transglycosylase [Niveispirillum sp. BGYR6]|uniref:monofunctional biosynthetic peptidoglycan transglycosylase n=1 Tax=Niveispirillum sp. BGYR6 TaxID=2971249 RepID=UPI0022B9A66B|nr:monofunctional biosynthetic peptidoglycan transglycosylase [Niveispirillum sp. BGYR6]MDG5495385.1 monofunctional biosynthetic peptidoglycan transglycosylase [Niveispirillum sp. BGYR6]
MAVWRGAGKGKAGRWLRLAAYGVAGFVAASLLWVLAYAVLPVPGTPLMLIRAVESGGGWQKQWQPLSRLSPHLARAVIAAEDSRFCQHGGVDWDAVEQALERNEQGGRAMRGGSTISQQVAKNAFLWPDRSWLRKGVELWFTGLVETFWSKRRIMEVYLNIVEWAPGVYGAEAAARHWFGKGAADLSPREAALLAAILPSPRQWKANPPGRYVAARAGILQRRMEIVRRDGLDDCVGR